MRDQDVDSGLVLCFLRFYFCFVPVFCAAGKLGDGMVVDRHCCCLDDVVKEEVLVVEEGGLGGGKGGEVLWQSSLDTVLTIATTRTLLYHPPLQVIAVGQQVLVCTSFPLHTPRPPRPYLLQAPARGSQPTATWALTEDHAAAVHPAIHPPIPDPPPPPRLSPLHNGLAAAATNVITTTTSHVVAVVLLLLQHPPAGPPTIIIILPFPPSGSTRRRQRLRELEYGRQGRRTHGARGPGRVLE